MSTKKLVEIKNLKTHFKVGNDWAPAVDGLDFDIYEGETLGIVGESGSGKSVSVLSLIQLIPNPPGEVTKGEIYFKGQKIFDGKNLSKVREVPQYTFFNQLSENVRKFAAMAFFLGLMVLYGLSNLSGVILFFASLILDVFLTWYIFFRSPRKKVMKKFRERMYSKMRNLRGTEIAMIFQEPMTSLNPVFTVGFQIIEALKPKKFREYIKDGIINTASNLHDLTVKTRIKTTVIFGLILMLISQLVQGWTFYLVPVVEWLFIGMAIPTIIAYLVFGLDRLISTKYRDESERLFREGVKLLDTVGIPEADKRMRDYPHQFSGGMRQRAMIAMALAKNPSLLIADEPTTALDVTIQAQILDLMLELKKKRTDAAVVLITHDLAVIAETCERVIVMYGGKIQEVANIEELFENPLHPYTHGLMNSIPRPDLKERKKRLDIIRGMVPSILEMPEGCKFCTRCDVKLDICNKDEPLLTEIRPDHYVRCHAVNTETAKA